MYKAIRKKKFRLPRWPSELLANLCRPICQCGQTGWHRLAGNSEGHRENSKIFTFSSRFTISEAKKMSFWSAHFYSIKKNFRT